MLKIFILDSNIIFSAALHLENPIGQFIMSANQKSIEFYAPEFLSQEVESHLPKLIEISGLAETKMRRVLQLLYTQINFISDGHIPIEYYIKALPFVREIDMDDLPFVALTEYLDELFWTGDMKLYNGLINNGYSKVITFDYIKENVLKQDL